MDCLHFFNVGLIKGMVDSNFFIAFCSSAIGAIAGALTVIFIESQRRKRRLLADINTSIGLLTILINTYLNIKKQHIIPLTSSYKENQRAFQNMYDEKKLNNLDSKKRYRLYLLKYECPPLHFDLPLDRIFELAGKHPQIIQIIMQAKIFTHEIHDACVKWNNLADVIMEMIRNNDDPRGYYFGIPSENTIQDTTCPNTIETLNNSTDAGIFFTIKAAMAIRNVGTSSLPFFLRNRVANFEILDSYKDLLPPEDYIEGWI